MTSVLLEEQISVRFLQLPSQSSSATSSKCSVVRPLVLKLEERKWGKDKEYVVFVTSEDDYCYVFSLIIRRENYKSMKRQQNLVREFDEFPSIMLDFIDEMGEESTSVVEGVLADDHSELTLELKSTIKHNRFTILSLRLAAVSGQNLTDHLVKRLKAINEARSTAPRKSQKVLELEERISSLADENKKVQEAFEKLDEQHKVLKSEKDYADQCLFELEAEVDDKGEEILELKNSLDELSNEYDDVVDQLNWKDKKLEEVRWKASEWEKKAHDYKSERDHWFKEQKKGVEIIKKMEVLLRTQELARDSDSCKRISSLEEDLQQSKATVGTLTETVKLLREECEKAKKDATEWKEKYEKKEKILSDFISYRQLPRICSPLTDNSLGFNSAYRIPFEKVLSNGPILTRALFTPPRNLEHSPQPLNLTALNCGLRQLLNQDLSVILSILCLNCVHILLAYLYHGIELNQAFDALDKDGDRRLNRSELAEMFRWCNYKPTRIEFDYIFRKFDADGSGYISKQEFLDYVRSTENTRHDEYTDADKVFRSLDTNRDGTISFEEFVDVVVNKARICDRDMAQFVFMIVDSDGDGRITYKEYKDIMAEVS
uniref:EF-hand domain-containing protein n=1 Tax=Syphacia muris TaxID=451379 RepID=A0A0N5AYA8_9BILA